MMGARARLAAAAMLLGATTAAGAAGSWCLGFDHLGPIRAGMRAEQVLRLADFSGLDRARPPGDCWYLDYRSGGSGPEFRLMILDGRVARLEIVRASTLHTLSGARIGSTENELRRLYGDRLESQPHKYDEQGRTFTWRSGDGAHGLRFETSAGRVTAMQSGPWEHLHYVEGCG